VLEKYFAGIFAKEKISGNNLGLLFLTIFNKNAFIHYRV
jgi:hypothetical protein